ncbi:MAG: F0F1 ATP synthase subunit B [Limisphaerales bacterium]|jgi:F-type H+-transporting ATPase subunit b|nr:F0F1 ATP synthase subunit B [Verrucomicrobiota bacterium]
MQELLIIGSLITDLGQTATETAQRFGLNWQQFFAQAINFCIVAGVLWFFASKPIIKLLEERKQRIAQSVADSKRIKEELEAAEAGRQQILTKAAEEAKALIVEARTLASQLREQESQKAVVAAEEIIAKAKEVADADYSKMLEQLKGEVCRLVVDTTAKVIGKALSPEDQKRLSDEALTQLNAGGQNS